jgi:uncharacterized membrane protein YdcZ (DUF606 family)
MARLDWSLRRSGSALSRWLPVVGGPLGVFTLLALFTLKPDPGLWLQIGAVVILPGLFLAAILFEETGLVIRRSPNRRSRRSSPKR